MYRSAAAALAVLVALGPPEAAAQVTFDRILNAAAEPGR
jgi:hypothetical protein